MGQARGEANPDPRGRNSGRLGFSADEDRVDQQQEQELDRHVGEGVGRSGKVSKFSSMSTARLKLKIMALEQMSEMPDRTFGNFRAFSLFLFQSACLTWSNLSTICVEDPTTGMGHATHRTLPTQNIS